MRPTALGPDHHSQAAARNPSGHQRTPAQRRLSGRSV